MTVCIAAQCRGPDGRVIVLCTDRKTSSALGSAETALKLRYLDKHWRMLTAGSERSISALYKLYYHRFFEGDVTPDGLDTAIKSPLFERKRGIVDEYLKTRFAMPYDDFVKFGKEKLPADMFTEAMRHIKSIDLNAELIIAGFIEKSVEIYQCESNGEAYPVEDFAVIGEGSYLAQATLMRRSQSYVRSLDETLYNVYEAKRYAESVGSVGTATSLTVLHPDGRAAIVNSNTRVNLRTLFQEYGPKNLPDGFKLGEPYFDEQKTQPTETEQGAGNVISPADNAAAGSGTT